MQGTFSFFHPVFGELHGMVENEALWLIGKDVTRALGYKDAQIALQNHVKPEDKKPLEEEDDLKNLENATIMINESGLYSLCFFCKRSKAQKFKQWMVEEIMPAVRQNLERLAIMWEEKRLPMNISADNIGCFNSDRRNNGNCNSGNFNRGDANSGRMNEGNKNSGERNIGDNNTGDGNRGDNNAGDGNIESHNTGNSNAGNYNSGHNNRGDHNAGSSNIGFRNSGFGNQGWGNSGDWNLTDDSSGCFNTEPQKIYLFNRPSHLTLFDWRTSRAFSILLRIISSPNEWIDDWDATETECREHPDLFKMEGYLKKLSPEDRFAQNVRNWNALSEEDKRIVMAIPNFDAGIFKQITGIDVNV